MATFYWIAASAGNASVEGNWSGTGVPSTPDTIIFNSANSVEDCTMDIAEVTTLTMETSYTGTITLDNDFEVSGHLSMGKGTLDTGADHALTVGLTLEVDGASAVLICNDSALTCGQVDTITGIGLYNSGGTLTGGTGDWTISSYRHNGGTSTLTDGTITLNGRESSSGASIDIRGAGTTHPAGGKIVMSTKDSDISLNGNNLTLNDLEILNQDHEVAVDAASDTLTLASLRVTAGLFDTGHTGRTYDCTLTVTGTTSVAGGTLTLNSSTVTLGSGKVDAYALVVTDDGTFNGDKSILKTGTFYNSEGTTNAPDGDGSWECDSARTSGNWLFDIRDDSNSTFNHNDGTVTLTCPGVGNIETGKAPCPNFGFYNLTINDASADYTVSGDPMIVENDLTITAGTLDTGADLALTVDGDAIIDDGGTLTGNDSAISFRSLEVKNGGTYDATSGVTTLDGETTGGECLDFEATSTFNHNNGTIKFDGGSNTRYRIHSSDACYNLEVDGGGQIYFYTAMNVDNNVTVTDGKFVSDQGGATVDIKGSLFLNNGIFGWTAGTWAADTSFGNVIMPAGASPEFHITSGTTTIKGNLINHGGQIY